MVRAMAIHKRPLTTTLVRQLFELACTPFKLATFHERWNSYGWSYQLSAGDDFGFQVQVPHVWPLSVDPLGEEIIGATLPFLYWDDLEDWDDDEDWEIYAGREEYKRQRDAYDAEFEAATKLALATLPPPWQYWTDAD